MPNDDANNKPAAVQGDINASQSLIGDSAIGKIIAQSLARPNNINPALPLADKQWELWVQAVAVRGVDAADAYARYIARNGRCTQASALRGIARAVEARPQIEARRKWLMDSQLSDDGVGQIDPKKSQLNVMSKRWKREKLAQLAKSSDTSDRDRISAIQYDSTLSGDDKSDDRPLDMSRVRGVASRHVELVRSLSIDAEQVNIVIVYRGRIHRGVYSSPEEALANILRIQGFGFTLAPPSAQVVDNLVHTQEDFVNDKK